MKTRTFLLASLLSLMGYMALSAQTIVKGDMNGDGQVTVADVTSVVNTAVGVTPMETIPVGTSGNPYMVDNSTVVGTWYAADGSHFVLNADGTTDFPGGATYEFMPMHGDLLIYDATGLPVKALHLIKVATEYLLATDFSFNITYYTNSSFIVSEITLSQSPLTLPIHSTAQLTATVTPSNAPNPRFAWSSSDTNIATVDQNGLVTAVSGGTCTITCAAKDGSGVTTTCEVSVWEIILSQTTLYLELDEFQKLTATANLSNFTLPALTWTSSDENVAEVTSRGLVCAIGLGTCTITATAQDGSGTTATCEVIVFEDNSGSIGGHDYIDLGLPSGTLWATCNIGADNPEDYGDYFAWGETSGYNSGKTTFDWNTYQWCNGSSSTLTKYNTSSSNGTVDNKTELELADDAAYVNWGSNWRMPSKEQFAELINSSYTTTTWTTENGFYGRRITSKLNGNSIFLPAAGCRYDTSFVRAGSHGIYWSRTLVTDYPYRAWFLYFLSGNVRTYYRDYIRSSALSVRPVRLSE